MLRSRSSTNRHASVARAPRLNDQTWLSMRLTGPSPIEIRGRNGILLENDVAWFFADAEAIYRYEGPNEINSLVAGRAITGLSALL